MRFFLASAGLAAIIAVPLFARDMPPPPPEAMHGPRRPPQPINRAAAEAMVTRHFAEIDADHDGAVTKAEYASFRDARNDAFETRMKEHRNRAFDRLDANRDGTLSKSEFDAPPGNRPAGPGDLPPPGAPGPGAGGGRGMMMIGGARWFEQADADRDGKVTLAEAKANALATFDRLDADHDGTLSPDEMRAKRGAGRDMPPPPPPEQ